MNMYISKSCVVFLVLLATACQNNERAVDNIPQHKIQKILATGEKVAVHLQKILKGELQAAIKTGGPENAIAVCNTRALQLTSQLSDSFQVPVEIKRTTFKYRNAANAPDAFEQKALKHFSNLDQDSQPPVNFIQPVDLHGQKGYDYYKPLYVQPLCLNCHGDPDTMVPGLLTKINSLYPNDKATGYKLNDFRGVIRIRIADSNLR